MDAAAAYALLAERMSKPHEENCSHCVENVDLQSVTAHHRDALTCQPTIPLPPKAELEALSDARLLQLLLQQQERRTNEYRRFEEGFTRFLQVAEAEGYQGLVAATTAIFADISKTINVLEEEFRRRGGPFTALAGTARRLQELEGQKLTVTAQLHIVRHGVAVDQIRTRACAHADEAADADDAHVDEGGDGAQREEPKTQLRMREATAARLRIEELEELRAKLAALVEQINEVLDELRCELADLES
jgi:hypothetical protein